MSYSQASSPRTFSVAIVALMMTITTAFSASAADKKPAPPPPARAQSPVPAVTNDYIHKEFGDNCSLLPGASQFVGDLDGDGIDDLVVAARCKNPMADQGEYGFRVSDPFDTDFGYGNVKVTSGFITEEPDRKGVVLLVVHGVGPEAWRSDKEKPKFLLINLPFTSLTVKRLELKKRTVLGIYMVEDGEGDPMSGVVFWDGKKYRYHSLGSAME
jgi:hypothetical protein